MSHIPQRKNNFIFSLRRLYFRLFYTSRHILRDQSFFWTNCPKFNTFHILYRKWKIVSFYLPSSATFHKKYIHKNFPPTEKLKKNLNSIWWLLVTIASVEFGTEGFIQWKFEWINTLPAWDSNARPLGDR